MLGRRLVSVSRAFDVQSNYYMYIVQRALGHNRHLHHDREQGQNFFGDRTDAHPALITPCAVVTQI